MNNWFKKLHTWISESATTRRGTLALFICAFADSSILPLPVTTFFLILIMMNTRMVFKYLFFVLLGTMTGALAGYTIGHLAWLKPDGEYTRSVQFLFNHVPGFSEAAYQKIHILYTKWDFWILCAAPVTPLPYAMFSIASGVFEINILIFLITTLVSQSIKYLFLSILAFRLGPRLTRIMDLNWKPLALIASISIGIAVVAIRVL